MEINWIAIIVAALIPTFTGFIWYNPSLFGKVWMKVAMVDEEKIKGTSMPLIFGVSILLSLLLAVYIETLVIHQHHISSILMNESGFGDPNSEVGTFMADFMNKYGNNFRTFRHGAFHGLLAGVMFVLPILGTNALFERKGWQYILINAGYWTLTLSIMGGIICGWV